MDRSIIHILILYSVEIVIGFINTLSVVHKLDLDVLWLFELVIEQAGSVVEHAYRDDRLAVLGEACLILLEVGLACGLVLFRTGDSAEHSECG